GEAVLGDAADARRRLTAGVVNRAHGVGERPIVEIVGDDARALGRELERDGATDAATSAGHQRDFALQRSSRWHAGTEYPSSRRAARVGGDGLVDRFGAVT